MFQDFLPLGQEFLIKAGLFYKISAGRWLWYGGSHSADLRGRK
jgi:hypothetical protein